MAAPSSAVLLEKIENLSETIKINQRANQEVHGLILEQTTKTNGRVTKVEEWKNKVAGGLIVTNLVLVAIIIPVGFIILKEACLVACH